MLSRARTVSEYGNVVNNVLIYSLHLHSSFHFSYFGCVCVCVQVAIEQVFVHQLMLITSHDRLHSLFHWKFSYLRQEKLFHLILPRHLDSKELWCTCTVKKTCYHSSTSNYACDNFTRHDVTSRTAYPKSATWTHRHHVLELDLNGGEQNALL